MSSVITGFHAIEENVRSVEKNPQKATELGMKVLYSKLGPRVKKIIAEAEKNAICVEQVSDKELDLMTANLPEVAREHRGIVLLLANKTEVVNNRVVLDHFVASMAEKLPAGKKTSIVVVLDSVTDPHNVGAIIRSCDQFGVDLVVLPERRGSKDGEIVGRSSAGAVSWVPTTVVPNLVRAIQQLKEAGYWVYGADAGGTNIANCNLSGKIVIIMGSEGTGISRLLTEQCDGILSIPTCGKLDSLNVSVAAGILLYEIVRQNIN